MSSVTMCHSNGVAGEFQRPVSARSYYNLAKTHSLPSSNSLSRLPEVSSANNITTRGSVSVTSSGTTLLIRPPSAQVLQMLPEPSDDVYAPVPVRTAPVPRVLPTLPCNRSPAKSEGGMSGTAASHVPSPDSAFRSTAFHVASHYLRERDAEMTVEESKVKPMLCPPMKPLSRTTPVISSAALTNPFCPDGVHVKHLPSCSPRVLCTAGNTTAARPQGRYASASHSPAINHTTPSLWDDAASDAEVLAFFGTTTNGGAHTNSTTPTSSPSPSADQNSSSSRRVSKEISWPGAETTQSSICELSFSEGMFSMGTTSSDGSADCTSGSHRGSVIDVEALASFQRDGARRQREVFALASIKTVTQ